MRGMGPREKIAGMEMLVTGAGGFVGSALVPELTGRGHTVRAATRHPDRYQAPAGAVAHRLDLDDQASLAPALDGVEVAYYLVHSMAQKGSFARRDPHHARAFGRAARAAGVDRVIYLSGLGDQREGLSEHLASRRAVEDALASTGPDLTVLRAAIVLGRGGASFEMLVQLVRRLPVMVCPSWVDTTSQPIALSDAVGYLADAAATEATRGQRLEIGGPEVLTYREMMLRFARLEGRRRLIVSVPCSPRGCRRTGSGWSPTSPRPWPGPWPRACATGWWSPTGPPAGSCPATWPPSRRPAGRPWRQPPEPVPPRRRSRRPRRGGGCRRCGSGPGGPRRW
jgi:uncharacterized protein YbjT (DUF2867 family)